MKRVYFKANLSKERKWLEENNNVELYSCGDSFLNDNVLWRFNLYSIEAADEVYGFIEKKRNAETLSFTWKEAHAAVTGNFLEVRNIRQTQCQEPQRLFDLVESEYVAFTLRTNQCNKNELEPWASWGETKKIDNVNNAEFWVETGSIRDYARLSNVHGLLTLERSGRVSLEESALMLSRIFPKRLVIWMTYCHNEEAYRRKLIYDDSQYDGFEGNYS